MTHWPQIAVLFFLGLTLTVSIVNHGKDRKVNGVVSFVDTAVWLLILWTGGFFQ